MKSLIVSNIADSMCLPITIGARDLLSIESYCAFDKKKITCEYIVYQITKRKIV